MTKKNRTKKLAIILAVLLALLMILPVLVMIAEPASAATQSELNALKKKAAELAKQKQTITSSLAKAKKDKQSAVKEKAALDSKIKITEEQIDNATAMIEQLSQQITDKEGEIAGAQEKEQLEYEIFKKRVRVMEEDGTDSYVTLLLGAESFSDFLCRLEVINDIVKYDNNLMDTLAAIRQGIETAKSELEASKSEQDANKKELLAYQEDLEASYKEQTDYLATLESDIDEYEKAYEESVEAQEEAQKEIAKMTAALASKTVYVGGTYAWPLPASNTTITSPFGMRMHPILKKYKLHTGVDISAKTGTPIYAANSGTVITAGWNNGYGNYVVIDHGGGQCTLYAHMSKILTSKGSAVKKGDTIGKVGTTGYSTGPHLHFEIIINGKQVDPMNYFKKTTA